MSKNLISVIIPVYNVEKYLHRCLDSVVNQKEVNLEIILVDDGSTDASGKICDEYAERDNRITVIHQQNGGLSNARNNGLKTAKGEYIGFVDSDDWIAHDMYRYLLHILRRHKADMSVCDYVRTEKIKKIREGKEELALRTGEDLDRFFFRADGGKSFFSVCNRLYKKRLLEGLGFEEGTINEDIFFTYEVYKKARIIVFSNLPKYFYFINKNAITSRKVCKKDYAQFRIWDRIMKCEKDTENYELALMNRKRAVFNLYMKAKLFGISDEMPKDTMRRWREELKKNYHLLMKGKALNMQRKAALFCICKWNW